MHGGQEENKFPEGVILHGSPLPGTPEKPGNNKRGLSISVKVGTKYRRDELR